MLVIRHDPQLRYPEGVPSGDLAVYDSVDLLLRDAGLDKTQFGGDDWNPFGEFVSPGGSIFVLCNFVCHRRPKETLASFAAKCTHASVLRPVLDYALRAVGKRGAARFGNAPVQSCEWDRVLSDTGARLLLERYAAAGTGNVTAMDLRAHVAHRNRFGSVTSRESPAVPDVVFELDACESWMERLCSRANRRYRVTDYSRRRTEGAHSGGRHRYSVSRAVLDSDLIISLPKLKTHEKVGLTCCLKGLVGTVTEKECLGHHRRGSPSHGGDEYPQRSTIRAALSGFHDCVNDMERTRLAPLFHIADRCFHRALRSFGAVQSGSWYGNDTAWRMVLDLYRIVTYGRNDGTIAETPQRTHIGLIDGVIAGEGDGPLTPSPRHDGLLVFTDDLVAGDTAAAYLMGFDPVRIPMIREAWRASGRTQDPLATEEILVNGRHVTADEIRASPCHPFRPPRGWVGHIELGTPAGIPAVPSMSATHRV